MQVPVEIRYEGAVIARCSSLSGSVDDGGTLFLATNEPMPVGTKLELWGREDVALVRVVKVIEASDREASGMAVRAVGLSEPVDISTLPVIAHTPASSPSTTASGSFETPPALPRPVTPIEVREEAAPIPVSDEGSLGSEDSGLNDISGVIESGGPTEEYPALGNGANAKRRRRTKRR